MWYKQTEQLKQMSIVNQRKHFFQNSIRRDYIQKFFHLRRQELIKHLSSEQNNYLRGLLKTQGDRLKYIKELAGFFDNVNMMSWGEKIKELSSLLDLFQGKFDSLVNQDITFKLGEVFKQDSQVIQIQTLTAKLFCDMVLLSNPKACFSNAYFLDSQIVENVVILLRRANIRPHQKIQFVKFLAQLCCLSYKIRNSIVDIGGGEILVNFGQELLMPENMDEQLIFLFVGSSLSFAKIFRQKDKQYFPQLDFSISLLAPIIKILSMYINEKIVHACLLCLSTIFKQKRNNLFKKMMSQNRHIFEDLKTLLQVEHPGTKQTVISLLNWLAYHYRQLAVPPLYRIGIFDVIENQISRLETSRSFIIVGLNLVSNMLDNQKAALEVVNHGLTKMMVSLLKNSNEAVCEAAYSAFVVITDHLSLKHKQVNDFIVENRLVPVLISQISTLRPTNPSNIFNALNLIRKYITANMNKMANFNSAINQLQSYYDLAGRLQALIQIPTEGQIYDQIREQAGDLLDVMVEHLSNDVL